MKNIKKAHEAERSSIMKKSKSLAAMALCLSVFISLCGCGNSQPTEESSSASTTEKSETVSTSAVETEPATEESSDDEEECIIDYGDAESFEADLNEGKNLEGKIVRFVAGELHPKSAYGYNIWAGEHLNFVSSRNPDVQENDTVTVRTSTIENIMGSWIISYEKVDNAVMGDDTIIYTESEKDSKGDEETKKEDETSKSDDFNTDDYEHNDCYDIVETASITDSIGDTILIHKVLAKKNTSVSGTVLAYAPDGSVIGKSSDDIVLTEGEYNYFQYYFESDISNATLETQAKAEKDSFMTGERDAVEMVQYNQSEDNLYITFKQKVDELDYFAKFKLLFYKGDKIVETEDGYFSTYAENLNGKDSTDVAEIWIFDVDYDRIEYIFEP